MKTLCLYYSRTNLTRVIMNRIAMLTDADVYEYTDGVDRSGIMGYLRSCIDCTFRDINAAFAVWIEWIYWQ